MNIVRNSLLSIAGTGGLAAMNLVVGIVLARSLAPEGFGQYALVGSTVALMAVIGSMGLGGALIYWINRKGMDVGSAATLMVQSSAALGVLTAAVCAIALYRTSYFGQLSSVIVLSAGVFAIGQIFVSSAKGIFISQMQVARFVIVQNVPVAILLICSLALAAAGQLTLQTTFVFIAIGQAVGIALTCWFLREHISWFRPFSFGELAPLLRYGAMINVAYFLFMFGIEGGVVILRAFDSDFGELGFYRVAMRIAGIMLMGVSAVGPLLFSKYAASEGDSLVQNVERTSRVYYLVILGSTITLELISPYLIEFLFGIEFRSAVPVLQVILIGVAGRALAGPMLEMFYSRGAPRLVAVLNLINILLMVVLMALLIPGYAAVGAGIAFAVSNILTLFAVYFIAASKYAISLGRCFLITSSDLKFLLNNLRPVDQRTT